MPAKYSNPVEFAKYLIAKKTVWRRSGHPRSIGARRHYRDLARREVRAFRSSFGMTAIPRIAVMSSSDAWLGTSAQDVKIIVPARELRDGVLQDTSSGDARRILRRAIRSSVVDQDGAFELVSAKNVSVGRKGIVARSSDAEDTSIRGLFFEQIGVAVVPGLTNGQVEALEADGLIVIANDPVVLDEPAGEHGSSVQELDPWHLAAIGISAHGRRLSGKGVTIGVLDTGIDANHPEFIGKKIDFLEFDHLGLPKKGAPVDFHDHGTHVSALSAGRNVGVAPDASLAVAAVLTERRNNKMVGYTAQILGGLNWLASKAVNGGNGVDIINASLGSTGDEKQFFSTFLPHHLNGRLIVAAIGNEGAVGVGTHTHPARFEFAIGVGACDRDYNMADFSAWGQTYPHANDDHKPDLVAPGVSVQSAVPNGGYKRKNGTSMACPIVSGTAALIIEGNEALRGDCAGLKRRVLELTCALPATPHNSDTKRSGRGRLDLSLL